MTLKLGVGSFKVIEMASFDRSYTTFYWSAIVSIDLVPFSSYLTLNNIVNLKSGLKVTEDHSNWYNSKAWVRFPSPRPSELSRLRPRPI